jgi:TRAP-type uncharacterized transport system fused permease subunit
MRTFVDTILNCPPIWLVRIFAATLLSGFSIYTAFWGVFPDMIQRSFHIGMILFLVYLAPLEKMSLSELVKSIKGYLFIAVAILSLLVMIYQIIFFDAINDRYGDLTYYEFYLGLAATFFLLDATRRTIGWPITILAIIFLSYAVLGNFLPGEAGHRGYSLIFRRKWYIWNASRRYSHICNFDSLVWCCSGKLRSWKSFNGYS